MQRLIPVVCLMASSVALAEMPDEIRSKALPTSSALKYLNLSQKEIDEYERQSIVVKGMTVDNLNPLELLGITSRNLDDKRRYAKAFVRRKIEHTRASLEWSLLVQEETEQQDAESYFMASELIAESLAKEGYRLADERRKFFNIPKKSSTAHTSENFTEMYRSFIGERTVLFLTDDCRECEQKYLALVAGLDKGTTVGIDVVFAGMEEPDREAITRWAMKAKLSPNGEYMKSRKITLNYEGERWAALRKGRQVPLVVNFGE